MRKLIWSALASTGLAGLVAGTSMAHGLAPRQDVTPPTEQSVIAAGLVTAGGQARSDLLNVQVVQRTPDEEEHLQGKTRATQKKATQKKATKKKATKKKAAKKKGTKKKATKTRAGKKTE